jgi:anti-anti-sigma regulatory factor
MNIKISKTERPVPITILHLDGTLDGANFESLVKKAQSLFNAGARDLILDLSKLTFISSAGLRALHQVALLFRGKLPEDPQESWDSYRWAAYRSLDREHYRNLQEHVKLLSPSPEVRQVLDMIGYTSLFEIYANLPQAVETFRKPAPELEASFR